MEELLTLSVLTICVLACSWTVYVVRMSNHRGWFCFTNGYVIMFAIVMPLSGIAHIFNNARSIGFFDLYPTGRIQLGDAPFAATVATALATVAVCVAATTGRSRPPWLKAAPDKAETISQEANRREGRVPTSDRRLLLVMGLAVSPIAALGTAKMFTAASTSSTSRITSIDGGLARFAFLSHWTAWAVTFLVLFVVSSPVRKSRFVDAAAVIVGSVIVALSLQWTGGRSIVLVLVLPLLIVALPRIGGARWWAVLVLGGLAIANVVRISVERSQGYRDTTGAFSVNAMTDWQWGRFSMLGWSANYVEDHGYLAGETLLSGLLSVPRGILATFGAAQVLPNPRTAMELTGQEILNNPQIHYILPGMSGELYLNFGYVGVAVGFFGVVKAVKAVDRKFEAVGTGDITVKLLWAYAGTISIFCTIPAQSGALPNYLLFSGAPLILIAALSRIIANRREPKRVQNTRGPTIHV